MESLNNQQAESSLHVAIQSGMQPNKIRLSPARIYAGLAGTCVFALAVLFACSKRES